MKSHRIKMFALGLALAMASTPTLVAAMCMDSHTDTAASCAEGMVFDAKTGTCVSQTTS